MELSGRVIRLLPLVTGKGRNGEWRKQEFIVETPGQYPKQICCSLWGDKIDEAQLKEGEEIKAGIDVQSREHNGRWYTEVRAWKVERQGGKSSGGPNTSAADTIPDEADDLPF